MTFLRHAPRHVHQSVIDYLTDQLTTLGWLGPDVPFGLPIITIIETRPFVGGTLDNRIAAGTVTISMGDEHTPLLEELGGPLSSQEYLVFVDVFMEKDSAALALAADVRDAFLGRHDTSKTAIPVTNQIDGDPVVDWRIYFTDVERVAPEHTFPLAWHSVHLTAEAYFPEVVW